MLFKYLAAAHNAIVANVWLDQLKYLHRILKSIKHSAIPTTNNGIATINLLTIGPCLYLIVSAIVSLALLNAVSPEVIGQATTPNSAKAPPTFPYTVLEILFTTTAAPPCPNASPNPGVPPKKLIAAAAHTNATIPSDIIAP